MPDEPIFAVSPSDEPAPPPPGLDDDQADDAAPEPGPEPAARGPRRPKRRPAGSRDESIEHVVKVAAGILRATMAPDAPPWSSAWIPTEDELAAMTAGLDYGAEAAGLAPVLDEYGPAIAAAGATFAYVTRSMRETRAYRAAAAVPAPVEREPFPSPVAPPPAPSQEAPSAGDPDGDPGADDRRDDEPRTSLDVAALASLSERIAPRG